MIGNPFPPPEDHVHVAHSAARLLRRLSATYTPGQVLETACARAHLGHWEDFHHACALFVAVLNGTIPGAGPSGIGIRQATRALGQLARPPVTDAAATPTGTGTGTGTGTTAAAYSLDPSAAWHLFECTRAYFHSRPAETHLLAFASQAASPATPGGTSPACDAGAASLSRSSCRCRPACPGFRLEPQPLGAPSESLASALHRRFLHAIRPPELHAFERSIADFIRRRTFSGLGPAELPDLLLSATLCPDLVAQLLVQHAGASPTGAVNAGHLFAQLPLHPAHLLACLSAPGLLWIRGCQPAELGSGLALSEPARGLGHALCLALAWLHLRPTFTRHWLPQLLVSLAMQLLRDNAHGPEDPKLVLALRASPSDPVHLQAGPHGDLPAPGHWLFLVLSQLALSFLAGDPLRHPGTSRALRLAGLLAALASCTRFSRGLLAPGRSVAHDVQRLWHLVCCPPAGASPASLPPDGRGIILGDVPFSRPPAPCELWALLDHEPPTDCRYSGHIPPDHLPILTPEHYDLTECLGAERPASPPPAAGSPAPPSTAGLHRALVLALLQLYLGRPPAALGHEPLFLDTCRALARACPPSEDADMLPLVDRPRCLAHELLDRHVSDTGVALADQGFYLLGKRLLLAPLTEGAGFGSCSAGGAWSEAAIRAAVDGALAWTGAPALLHSIDDTSAPEALLLLLSHFSRPDHLAPEQAALLLHRTTPGGPLASLATARSILLEALVLSWQRQCHRSSGPRSMDAPDPAEEWLLRALRENQLSLAAAAAAPGAKPPRATDDQSALTIACAGVGRLLDAATEPLVEDSAILSTLAPLAAAGLTLSADLARRPGAAPIRMAAARNLLSALDGPLLELLRVHSHFALDAPVARLQAIGAQGKSPANA
ncbi:hypothetical protein H696_00345 [Fonticula alba]|uniref:Uncharacterized protein n=1 Tax=Fonticula alba TaxID=691883 RepID=A0A058ZH07_FONAL|nr:hypothetical protein H696_00345 [Fonticula alba]KCV72767.1 hypothetical protein H696_00345 [Fonticula alba]|eukprot:XP_009492468.1 hypothetical protein H696_00345 [Fonticula alba]